MGQGVDAAEYEIAIFVDGATRATQEFRVDAATLKLTASKFVEALADSLHTCAAPQAAGTAAASRRPA